MRPLPGLARGLGLGAVLYKDEAGRFGLGSFKALGGAYAVLRLLQLHLRERHGIGAGAADLIAGRWRDLLAGVTVATATDGNHGRSVAWGAGMFGCRCVVYIHEGVSAARERGIARYGAEVRRVPGGYDASVHRCADDAAANGWRLVADTSADGGWEVPALVMQGYGVLAEEALEQAGRDAGLTHAFVQAGVGGLAAAVAATLWQRLGAARPRTVIVEPERADCVFRTVAAGRPTPVPGEAATFMACLAAGEVSPAAWEILRSAADDVIALPDEAAEEAMRALAAGIGGDPPVVAGEVGLRRRRRPDRGGARRHACGPSWGSTSARACWSSAARAPPTPRPTPGPSAGRPRPWRRRAEEDGHDRWGSRLLEGRVALVTGAAQGIGRAVALAYAREGAAVAMADVAGPAVEAAASEVAAATGGRTLGLALDVTDAAATEAAVERVAAGLGEVDVAVAECRHPGTPPRGRDPARDLEPLGARGQPDGRLPHRHGLRAPNAGPGRRRADRLHLLALRPARRARNAAYSASKFGVVGLMQCMAAELAPRGILVNAVCPGQMDTEMLRGLFRDRAARRGVDEARLLADFEARIPVGRLGGIDELAGTYVWLASDLGRYVTGQAVTVDGGWQVG